MALRFPCPTCKRELSGPESIAGSEVQCPACQTVFLAGEPRGRAATGIAAQRHRQGAPPVSEVRRPYRDHSPDEDALPRPQPLSQGRGAYWFGLVALLVFAPLAFIGIVAWMLMGSRGVTSAPACMTTTAYATTTKTKWKEEKTDKWQTFTIPNTTTNVLLPGAPIAGEERKVEDAVVNNYLLQDGAQTVYVINTIRMAKVDRKPDQGANWLRDQLAAKLGLDTKRFRDVTPLETKAAVTGFQWRLEKEENDADSSISRAYWSDDDKGTTIYVFHFTSLHGANELDRVRFFLSIQIGNYAPRDKD